MSSKASFHEILREKIEKKADFHKEIWPQQSKKTAPTQAFSHRPSAESQSPNHLHTVKPGKPSSIHPLWTAENLSFLINEKLYSFAMKNQKTHYPKAFAPPKNKVQPPHRKPHVFSENQKSSYDYIKSYFYEFSEGFSKDELKKAYRQLAFRFHPDYSCSQASSDFILLQKHYENLLTLFS